MLGKNKGKFRNAKQKKVADPPSTTESDAGSGGDYAPPDHVVPLTIPSNVGSSLSFIEFADTMQPAMLEDLLNCALAQRPSIFLTKQYTSLVYSQEDAPTSRKLLSF